MGANSAVQAALGSQHSCLLRGDGVVRCAGSNAGGQLGNGQQGVSSPTYVDVAGISDAVQVVAGALHTCALHATGEVSCWGENIFAQIGDGTGLTAAVPVKVAGINNAVAITAGTRHNCARLADLRVMCWGANGFGQLGDGSVAGQPTPVFVKLQ